MKYILSFLYLACILKAPATTSKELTSEEKEELMYKKVMKGFSDFVELMSNLDFTNQTLTKTLIELKVKIEGLARSYAQSIVQKDLLIEKYNNKIEKYNDEIKSMDRKTAVLQKKLISKGNETLFYQILLGIRKRIEKHERLLYPDHFPNTKDRRMKWIIILKMVNHAIVLDILDILKEYRISIDDFATTLSDLYSEASNVFNENLDMPNISVAVLNGILEEYKVQLTKNQLRTLQVLTRLLQLPTDRPETIDPGYQKEQRCIEMKDVPFRPSNSNTEMRSIPVGLIKSFFSPLDSDHYILRICEEADTYNLKANLGDVLVEFHSVLIAATVLLHNGGSIQKAPITLNVVNCTEWDNKCHRDAISTMHPKPTSTKEYVSRDLNKEGETPKFPSKKIR